MNEAPQVPTPLVIPTTVLLLQDLARKAADDGQHDVALDALREISNRPGVKTTEFYLSVVANLAGGYLLLVPGKELYGVVLMGIATLAYNLSRAVAKRAGPAVVADGPKAP